MRLFPPPRSLVELRMYVVVCQSECIDTFIWGCSCFRSVIWFEVVCVQASRLVLAISGQLIYLWGWLSSGQHISVRLIIFRSSHFHLRSISSSREINFELLIIVGPHIFYISFLDQCLQVGRLVWVDIIRSSVVEWILRTKDLESNYLKWYLQQIISVLSSCTKFTVNVDENWQGGRSKM